MKKHAKTGKSDHVKSGNNGFWPQKLTSFIWNRADNAISTKRYQFVSYLQYVLDIWKLKNKIKKLKKNLQHARYQNNIEYG